MLKVDEAYLSRSQAFIFVLFSGLQGNGNSEGRGGAALRVIRGTRVAAWLRSLYQVGDQWGCRGMGKCAVEVQG